MFKLKESPQYIDDLEGKTKSFDATVLNERKVMFPSDERSVFFILLGNVEGPCYIRSIFEI